MRITKQLKVTGFPAGNDVYKVLTHIAVHCRCIKAISISLRINVPWPRYYTRKMPVEIPNSAPFHIFLSYGNIHRSTKYWKASKYISNIPEKLNSQHPLITFLEQSETPLVNVRKLLYIILKGVPRINIVKSNFIILQVRSQAFIEFTESCIQFTTKMTSWRWFLYFCIQY